MRRLFLASLFLAPKLGFPLSNLIEVVPTPLYQAEEHYRRHEFRQAYDLWLTIYPKQKDHLNAALRLSELKLLFEGVEPAVSVLQDFYKRTSNWLPARSKKELTDRWKQYRSTFLTDQGQSLFYQAQAKESRNDWEGTLSLFEQAQGLEKGNWLISLGRVRCLRRLRDTAKLKQALVQARELFPFDDSILLQSLEVRANRGEFSELNELLQKNSWIDRVPDRALLAQAYASVQSAKYMDAAKQVASLVSKRKPKPHPMAYFILGKSSFFRGERALASFYLKRFKESASVASCELDGWDVYDCPSRLQEVEKLEQRLS